MYHLSPERLGLICRGREQYEIRSALLIPETNGQEDKTPYPYCEYSGIIRLIMAKKFAIKMYPDYIDIDLYQAYEKG